jgi:ATP-dependent Clp protease protease subunit
MKKFYQLTQNNDVAELYIYGDITSEQWWESDVTPKNIVEEIKDITAGEINVYISSYGGEVQAGLAIYNALKRHKAKVRTICDGFACSIASVIFMAGEERIMNEASLLMVHNAWTLAQGNAEQLRKQADDLEKITNASVEAYKAHSSLSEEEIRALMDAETWISPEEALSYGFATSVEKTEKEKANQSALHQLFAIVRAHQEAQEAEEDPDAPGDDEEDEEAPADDEETPEPETEEPAEEPEDETEDDADADTEEETEEEAENTENPAQRWSGFFNAFLKTERRM